MSKYEENITLLIQIAWLGAIVVLGFCVAPGFAATISRSSDIEASLTAIWSMIRPADATLISDISGTRRSSVRSG
jgi:hypothetical protein